MSARAQYECIVLQAPCRLTPKDVAQACLEVVLDSDQARTQLANGTRNSSILSGRLQVVKYMGKSY